MSVMDRLAHTILWDRNEEPPSELAWVHRADPLAVATVLAAREDDPDGRSFFHWLRLPNGDLMLGVFPRGATYENVEYDAQFPGTPGEHLRAISREVAESVRGALIAMGYDVDEIFPSGNVEDGWIVEAERRGITMNIEIVGGPHA